MTVEVTVHGVNVKFPFPPYPSQLAMMSKAISAFKGSRNALLSSVP